jgi:hypothetical protein
MSTATSRVFWDENAAMQMIPYPYSNAIIHGLNKNGLAKNVNKNGLAKNVDN